MPWLITDLAAVTIQDSTLELEGEVSRILWRNPHIRLNLSVTGDGGEAATWAVEGTAPTIIQRYGITDPAVFTEPAVVEKFWLWDPELQVEEFNCTESY